MHDRSASVVAMADKCRSLIQGHETTGNDLPPALRPRHLVWMCDQIERRAEHWPDSKLHRWIGFVQCALMANRILDLDGAKNMFDSVKNAYLITSDDQDLTDHLDPDSSFIIDVGGQG